jgi:alkanesulfonate monooxygenase SsuD/methylene tetrahydromethanopterin reductase-like flavin-dependent oxidoreductase (luciferase family)
MKFGVLVPHFGEHASVEYIVNASRRIEEMGFDSVWVRDHIIWKPHGMEGTNITFVEPFLALAAIGAVTKRIELGTAVLIPIRWPLKVAQNLASLSFLTGGRVVAGIGLGGNPAEFAAAGFRIDDKEDILRETTEIVRLIWSGNSVSYQGRVFSFDDISIEPKPVRPIQLIYGGSTRASVRRAVQYTEGWLPGRIPMATLDDRLRLLRRLGRDAGKRMRVGTIPLVRIDRDRTRAREGIDIEALARSSAGAKNWVMPPSGGFRTLEDLEGLLVVGNPEDCRRGIEQFQVRGVEDFIVDFRLDYGRYLEKLELFAETVLPAFR